MTDKDDWLSRAFREAEREGRKLPDWARPVRVPPVTGDSISAYVAGLREASGTFEGTVDQAVYEALEASVPDLFPVEISTAGRPLPVLTAFMTQIAIRAGGDEWVLPVARVELHLAENRAVIWVRRAQ